MPLTGVFETTRRRARDGRRLQGQSAARHRRGARAARPVARTRASPTHAPQVANKPALQAHLPRALRHQHHARTGWPGWRSRTCSARRCATLRRGAGGRADAINGMILEGEPPAIEPMRVVGSPDPDVGRAGDRSASRRRSSASTPPRCWPRRRPLERREGRVMSVRFDVAGPRRRASRIDRPDVLNAVDAATEARAAAASGPRSSATATSARSCSPAPATAPSAPAPT